MTALLQAAVGAYALAWVLAVIRPRWARAPLVVGVGLHLGWMTWRGIAIGFFPLTNKAESFSAAALAMALVALIAWNPARGFAITQLTLTLAAGVAAALFPQELVFPSPLLRTVWYPLHVPLSFLAIATWTASAASGLCWWTSGDKVWLARVDRYALQGFGLWSASMICGGVWGVLAWGAYFMWDPKIIWSVILWFHYAGFVHLRLTPSLQSRPWVRPALAWAGIVWMLVVYVGTSFFFGKSSHAF
jgi:ABC-type transport system involved in cytochrome c biogenesis permease subunit